MDNAALLLGGLAVLGAAVVALFPRLGNSTTPGGPDTPPGASLPLTGQLTRDDVNGLAQELISEHGFNVPVCRAVAIAWVESNFHSGAVGDDGRSLGLMQTLETTARWLAADMGYTAFGIPERADLLDARTSMYFGLSYLDYLSRYKNVRRPEDWIVQSYNGGPGGHGSQTARYLDRYNRAKEAQC